MSEKQNKVYCTFQDAPGHKFKGHPESPNRFTAMKEWLSQPPYPEVEWLDYEPAQTGEVTLLHSAELLASLEAESDLGPHVFESAPSYVTKNSFQAALGAVGATLRVSRQIVADEEGRGFAIIRPPGHHAEPDYAMGFCLLNNIAIAAADAVAAGMGRVAIIDIDAHHGNGTQAAFIETPQVGYLSTHESDRYPYTGMLTSAPHARGRIINVPLPPFSGNRAFNLVMEGIIAPWVSQFKPEMIFVSVGYDTHFSDPLTTLTLDTRGFYEISRRLIDLADDYCNGRMMFVLEGGYDPLALRDNIQASLAAMCGRTDFPDHYGPAPDPSVNVSNLVQTITDLHHL